MKKEDVISAGIMTIVSILVLTGFTVAWFGIGNASITGIYLKAAGLDNIIVALEADGPDISTLGEDVRYADMNLQDVTNIEQDKLAPGQFGQVTFYVRPTDAGIEYCDVNPQLWICYSEMGEAGKWYPGDPEEDSFTDEERTKLEELYQVAEKHIQFFEDPAMTSPITDQGIKLVWSDAESQSKAEKEVTVYWKWHYEYPFSQYYTEDALKELSEETKKELIDAYDAEDTKIGNNVTAMKFHFTFSAQ